jgi:hypothetical protein
MLDRTERRFGLEPKRHAADTAYGTGRFLGWLVGHRIAPHIPVRDASQRDDGTFSRTDFRWDRRRGVYICPSGKVLHTTGTVHDGNTLRYRASKFDCEVCALKMQCRPKEGPARQIPPHVHEYARDVTRRLMRTKAFLKSRDQRKRVEMLCPLEESPRLRAHAAARSFRRARWRRHRAEPEDVGPPITRANHPPGGAHGLPEIAHASVSRVRVEVAANQAAAKLTSRHLSPIKPLTGISCNEGVPFPVERSRQRRLRGAPSSAGSTRRARDDLNPDGFHEFAKTGWVAYPPLTLTAEGAAFLSRTISIRRGSPSATR